MEKMREEATSADAAALMIGRVISSRGWKGWLSLLSRIARMDEFHLPIDGTSCRRSNSPDGRVNAKQGVEKAVKAMAATVKDGMDGMVGLL